MARVKSPAKPARARKKKKKKKKAGGRKVSPAAEIGVCATTGLPLGDAARRVWLQQVQDALASGSPATLVLFDVDGFGRHDQDLGEARANALLAEVAARIGASLDDPPGLGRLAGDLLGVVLETEVEIALSRVEQARLAVFASPVRVGSGVRKRKVEVAVSVGLSSLRRDADGLRELLAQAQSAVWRAKSLGGNRVGLAARQPMALKTSYYSQDQLARLKRLAARTGRKESVLLREALEDLFLTYKDRRPSGGGEG
jgi:two-component system cell cycle response regulator